jgi:hypothetical protein
MPQRGCTLPGPSVRAIDVLSRSHADHVARHRIEASLSTYFDRQGFMVPRS